MAVNRQSATYIVEGEGPVYPTGRMSRLAGVALTTASIMLVLVAVPLNSAALFYMSTAMVATIVASRVQAALAVRKLRIERFAPELVRVGELVTITLTLWTDINRRRPLITLLDHLPEGMVLAELSPTLPIAPAFGHPVQTQYHFRPMRRGRFRWSKITALGTDALGLVAMPKEYDATQVDLTVLPTPFPLSFDLNSAAGWGFSESEHGQSRGLGIQPRGVREYVSGDALRYVHWPSTARRGQLLVKEFETGAQASVAFFPQLSIGSDVGEGANTSLEQMCSNLAYLVGWMLRQGIAVGLPASETEDPADHSVERENQLLLKLAELEANQQPSISETIMQTLVSMPFDTHTCILVSVADAGLPSAIRQCVNTGHPVTVLIYDADAFPVKRGLKHLPTAADNGFIEQLRASGATVTVATRGESRA